MLPSFATQDIVIIRASYVDDHGNLVPDWADVSESSIPGCSVQPGPTREDLQNRDAFLIQWTVFAPPGTDVRAHDRVEYNGGFYEVLGQPQVWSVGIMDHVKFNLKKWEG